MAISHAYPNKNSRNPYAQTSPEPVMLPSVVSYIDILGYREMAMKAEHAKQEQEFLRNIRRAFSEGQKMLKGDFGPKIGAKDRYVIKAFTDNIVFGYPINPIQGLGDAEVELGSAFEMLSLFQHWMANEGFFIRGAISIGDVYIDDTVVVGKGFTEAYNGEALLARDPRIILTDSAVEAVKKHLEYYTDQARAPQSRDLYRDSDGQLFLNYLESVLIAEEDHGPFYEELEKHKQMVEERLDEFTTRPPIWSKYLWVANYHNFFCSQYPKYFNGSHMVDLTKLQLRPSTIV
jgi:hypothetical protein